MTHNIAILLNGEVKNDSRVIKTINTLAKKYSIDLFYITDKQVIESCLTIKLLACFQ